MSLPVASVSPALRKFGNAAGTFLKILSHMAEWHQSVAAGLPDCQTLTLTLALADWKKLQTISCSKHRSQGSWLRYQPEISRPCQEAACHECTAKFGTYLFNRYLSDSYKHHSFEFPDASTHHEKNGLLSPHQFGWPAYRPRLLGS